MRTRVDDLLNDLSAGDDTATDRLIAVVYDDLRAQARWYLRNERTGHTLEPTALVHEAFLRLVDQTRVDWRDRTHVVAAAAVAMRRVLVDHARRRGSAKRGGGARRVTLSEVDSSASTDPFDVDALALRDALEKLGALNARHARIVELR